MRNKHDTLQKQLLVLFEVKSCQVAAYELDAKTVFLFFLKKPMPVCLLRAVALFYNRLLCFRLQSLTVLVY